MSAGHERAENDQFNGNSADNDAPLFRRMTPLGSCKSPLFGTEFAPPNTIAPRRPLPTGRTLVPRLVLET